MKEKCGVLDESRLRENSVTIEDLDIRVHEMRIKNDLVLA